MITSCPSCRAPIGHELTCITLAPVERSALLISALADLAYDYRTESEIEQLTTTRPPTTRETHPDVDWNRRHPDARPRYLSRLREEEPSALGTTMSAPLLRLVGAIEAEEVKHAPQHPVRRALIEWERACRRDHRQVPGRAPMWTDHERGPICAQLAWAVIRDGCGVRYAALALDIGYPRAERLLVAAVTFMRRRIMRWEDVADARAAAVG